MTIDTLAVCPCDGSTAAGDTVIQADVNGDGKVDFEIGIVGSHTFSTGDFVL